MYEYKTERVAPQSQQSFINTYASFGWELVSSNETYNESTEITGVRTEVKSYNSFMQEFTGKDGVTTTKYDTVKHITNYVTLQFRRDTSIPNYTKIVELEHKTLDDIPVSPQKPDRSIATMFTILAVIGVIILAISIIRAISNGIAVKKSDFIIIGAIVLCVILAIAFQVRYQKKMREYEIALEIYDKEIEERSNYCDQARKLLDAS